MQFTRAIKRSIVNNNRLSKGYTQNQPITTPATTSTTIRTTSTTIRTTSTTIRTIPTTTLWSMRESMQSCKQYKPPCTSCGH